MNVLGVGLPDGAPIPIEGSNDFRRDREGNVIVTRLNEAMCQEIAKEGNGIYVRVDNSNSAQKAINRLSKRFPRDSILKTSFPLTSEGSSVKCISLAASAGLSTGVILESIFSLLSARLIDFSRLKERSFSMTAS